MPTDTQNTFILSLRYSWTTLHTHKHRPYTPNKTYVGSIACYRLLPHTHRSPSLSWCRSLCQKWELFFVEPQVKSQWTVLVGYLTISTNVSCYQTFRRRQYYMPFSNTAHACTSTWCALHSSTAAVQNSQLHFSWAMAPIGQNNTQLLITRLEGLQQRAYELQLNKTEEIKQRLVELWKHSSENMRFSCFCVLPGSAEALLRWSEKINHNLTAWSVGNIPAKKLSKSVDVRRSYSKRKQCRFLRHSVGMHESFTVNSLF